MNKLITLAVFLVLIGFARADLPPNVTLESPQNLAQVTYGKIVFSCKGFDDFGLQSLTLFGNWSQKWQAEGTKFAPANDSPIEFEAALEPGIYEWNCLAVDTDSASAFANESNVLIVGRRSQGTPKPQDFTRLTLDCDSNVFSPQAKAFVNNYVDGKPSCTGFGVALKYANGSNTARETVQSRGCTDGKSSFDLSLPEEGSYTFYAQGTKPEVSDSCTISFNALASTKKRVPDFHLLLLPLFAAIGLLLVRKR